MRLIDQLAQSGRLRRADVALADWIARAFPGAAPEVTLAAALAARAIADGHSALELARAQDWLAGLDGAGRAPALPALDGWLAALRAAPAGLPVVCDPQGRVYLRRYHRYEVEVARALIARASEPATAVDSAPPKGKAGAAADGPAPAGKGGAQRRARSAARDGAGSGTPGDDLDPEQQRAVAVALQHRLAIVTGGPGTGKTWSVVRMLVALAVRAASAGERLRIALAAPTGKAAARLLESVQAQLAALDPPEEVRAAMPTEARTLHRLLGLSPWRTKPEFDRTTPLPFDVVAVDEVSMVDLPLMTKLIDAVAPASRLILLGDPAQLAAVEAGDVLGALRRAAQDAATPLHACHAPLTVNHRFGASSALGRLADAIGRSDGNAAIADLQSGSADARLVEADLRHAVADAVAAYAPIIEAASPTEALAASRRFRVLTALRHGPSGCIALDRAIGASLRRRHGLSPDAPWCRGRLVLITVNRPELSLYNGDTGVVFPDPADPHRGLKAWFAGADGRPRGFVPAALPPHEGAFALTVHKAQGSEFERVALVTGPESAVLTRELLYTGVTRARSALTVYSTVDVLCRGIARRTLRMTGLTDRLREVEQHAPDGADREPVPG